jgi:hypothetical protein
LKTPSEKVKEEISELAITTNNSNVHNHLASSKSVPTDPNSITAIIRSDDMKFLSESTPSKNADITAADASSDTAAKKNGRPRADNASDCDRGLQCNWCERLGHTESECKGKKAALCAVEAANIASTIDNNNKNDGDCDSWPSSWTMISHSNNDDDDDDDSPALNTPTSTNSDLSGEIIFLTQRSFLYMVDITAADATYLSRGPSSARQLNSLCEGETISILNRGVFITEVPRALFLALSSKSRELLWNCSFEIDISVGSHDITKVAIYRLLGRLGRTYSPRKLFTVSFGTEIDFFTVRAGILLGLGRYVRELANDIFRSSMVGLVPSHKLLALLETVGPDEANPLFRRVVLQIGGIQPIGPERAHLWSLLKMYPRVWDAVIRARASPFESRENELFRGERVLSKIQDGARYFTREELELFDDRKAQG